MYAAVAGGIVAFGVYTLRCINTLDDKISQQQLSICCHFKRSPRPQQRVFEAQLRQQLDIQLRQHQALFNEQMRQIQSSFIAQQLQQQALFESQMQQQRAHLDVIFASSRTGGDVKDHNAILAAANMWVRATDIAMLSPVDSLHRRAARQRRSMLSSASSLLSAGVAEDDMRLLEVAQVAAAASVEELNGGMAVQEYDAASR